MNADFEVGRPYMEQVLASSYHLQWLVKLGAAAVEPYIRNTASPSFPDCVRGSVTGNNGTYVSFESIDPSRHAVMTMQRVVGGFSEAVMPVKVAESGEGFYYGLPTRLSAHQARLLAAGLK